MFAQLLPPRQPLLILAFSLFLAAAGRPAAAFAQSTGPDDPRDVQTFLDSVVRPQLDTHHIPGATVAVVKDGHVLVAQGYGSANLEQGTPVVADRTLFRVGSIEKLFVGTAVMQVAEQNRLDLHADVNTYLTAFKVPDAYPGRPITLAHLLTHTAGLEEHAGTYAPSAGELQPLSVLLAKGLPARVRPPGELTAYSNHGVTLAAYVVEQVSGQPFDDYLQEHVLRPLDMQHSTPVQPAPPGLMSDLAVGYSYVSEGYRPQPFQFVNVAPAGALSATATDIANFMIAHLQDGRFGDQRIMRAETAQEMHRLQFALDPRVDGMAYSFWEDSNDSNQRVLRHDGDTTDFHSLLALLPERNVGLFASYNSAGGIQARDELLRAFLDHYYPSSRTPAFQPTVGTFHDAGRVAGAYTTTRRGYTNWLKVGGIFSTPVVTSVADDRISVTLDQDGPHEFREVDSLLFRRTDGPDLVAFRADGQGQIVDLSWSRLPIISFERAPWYADPRFQLPLLGMSGLVFVVWLLVWPLSVLARRARHRSGRSSLGMPTLARLLAAVTSLTGAGLLVGLVVALTPPITQERMVLVLVLGVLVAILTGAVAVCAVLGWTRRYWGLVGCLFYTAVALAALGFVWDLNYWNLLGFHF